MADATMRFGVAVLCLLAVAGCRPTAEEGAEESRGPEVAVGQVRLSQEAQDSVGMTTEPVGEQEVRDSIPATGWLIVRPGSEVVVKAPLTGFVTPPSADAGFHLGAEVAEDQPLGTLHVLLSPQEQAQLVAAKEQADILIRQSQASRELAEAQLKRLEEGAASAVAGTRLAALRETVERSRAAEQEAREQLPFLPAEPYDDPPEVKPVPVHSPLAGRIVRLHVTPRQLVAQGEPLWTIADWSSLWVRVPVFVDDVPRVARQEAAELAVPGSEDPRKAAPVEAPQPTEPGRQTVDLYYEVENAQGELRPGQAVSLELPVGSRTSRLVVARSAILWDGMGNSWVYVQTAPQSFQRRKVELGLAVGEKVVVLRGLEAGEKVVTVGAETLYGEEFKGQLQVDEDD